MIVTKPIIKILRMITINNDSVLNFVIKYLYDIEKMSVAEIAAVLEISIGSIYKALKKNIS